AWARDDARHASRTSPLAGNGSQRLARRTTRTHAPRGSRQSLGCASVQPAVTLLRFDHYIGILSRRGVGIVALDRQERLNLSHPPTGHARHSVARSLHAIAGRWFPLL